MNRCKLRLLLWLADRWLPDEIGLLRSFNALAEEQQTTYVAMNPLGVMQGVMLDEVARRERTDEPHTWSM